VYVITFLHTTLAGSYIHKHSWSIWVY